MQDALLALPRKVDHWPGCTRAGFNSFPILTFFTGGSDQRRLTAVQMHHGQTVIREW
jgi:hypothetical protein